MSADLDFFQPGVTYVSSEFPQYGWKFRCDTVTSHPEDGQRTALGWRFFKGEWNPYAYYADDWDLRELVTEAENEITAPEATS
jgi:hypothetical protein